MNLDAPALRRVLARVTAGFCLAGLLAELTRERLTLGDHPLVSLLSLSYEGNLPSWYASALPLACAGLLAWISTSETADRPHWRVLAFGFLAISIDEAVGFHELLGSLFDTTGVLHFGWVIPASALVVALGLYFLGFLRRLSPETAAAFVIAGGIYVTGAVLLELPLGWWTEQHGEDNLGYYLIDWCEETLELIGLTAFAGALLRRLTGRSVHVTDCP